MNYCKDCKYWMGNQECDVDWIGINDSVESDGIAIYADAHDDSGLQTGLKTGPFFGCNRFEKL